MPAASAPDRTRVHLERRGLSGLTAESVCTTASRERSWASMRAISAALTAGDGVTEVSAASPVTAPSRSRSAAIASASPAGEERFEARAVLRVKRSQRVARGQ